MNYQKIYNDIIDRAKIRNLKRSKEFYTENHHIIPKSLGGNNDINNLVRLTLREHFICHLMLAKIYREKMIYAAWAMINQNGSKIKVNSRTYNYLKILFYSIHSKNMIGSKPWNKGLTKETDERVLKNAESTSKSIKGIKRKPQHNITKLKISKALTGKSKTKEHNEKNSLAQKGKIYTKEHKENISIGVNKAFEDGSIGKKISKSLSGKSKTKEHNEKNRLANMGYKNHMYGKIFIYNLETKERIKIKKEDLQFYLNKNWIKGRKIKEGLNA